jgi:hypothetical protein
VPPTGTIMLTWRLSVMLVVSVLPAAAAAQLPLRDVRSYGAAEHTDESIRWVTVSDRGRVVIGQSKTHRQFFYDPEGTLLGSFGRAGSGPGEFMLPMGAGWIADTLWVADMQHLSVTLISPSRTLLRSFRWPATFTGAVPVGTRPTPMSGFPRSISVDRSMTVALSLSELQAGQSGASMIRGVTLVGIDSSGEVLRTVGRVPTRFCPDAPGALPIDILLCGSEFPSFSPNGTVFATLADMPRSSGNRRSVRLTLSSYTGTEIFHQDISGTALPVPDSTRERMFQRLSRANAQARAYTDVLRGARLPYGIRVIAGSDSSAWVEMYAPSGREWHVFNGRGRKVAVVTARPTDEVAVVFTDRAFAIRRDPDTGVEEVVLLRW